MFAWFYVRKNVLKFKKFLVPKTMFAVSRPGLCFFVFAVCTSVRNFQNNYGTFLLLTSEWGYQWSLSVCLSVCLCVLLTTLWTDFSEIVTMVAFLQWCDTVGWVAGRTSACVSDVTLSVGWQEGHQPVENLAVQSPMVLLRRTLGPDITWSGLRKNRLVKHQ